TKKAEEKSGRRNRGRDKDDDEPVVGLGDHVPAFILRPVKLPKRATKETEDDLEQESENA
ncbi:MAG TPA: RNA helicase, partial [Rhodobiaceae bacterium]|nr:RNA helicase [Rhodobiaceae bacterium]